MRARLDAAWMLGAMARDTFGGSILRTQLDLTAERAHRAAMAVAS
jgi:hypothetical protein